VRLSRGRGYLSPAKALIKRLFNCSNDASLRRAHGCTIILYISQMVRDGYYYGFALLAAAALIAWFTGPLWALPAVLLAAFFFWFFRDPDRVIPNEPGALVSPADGKVTAVMPVTENGVSRLRVSIFLNVFDVHVNRSPISGTVRAVRYQKGKFVNAMNAASADQNEQNVVTVEDFWRVGLSLIRKSAIRWSEASASA
jgi:phosphatidylserine decarboxylase precursor-related protein